MTGNVWTLPTRSPRDADCPTFATARDLGKVPLCRRWMDSGSMGNHNGIMRDESSEGATDVRAGATPSHRFTGLELVESSPETDEVMELEPLHPVRAAPRRETALVPAPPSPSTLVLSSDSIARGVVQRVPPRHERRALAPLRRRPSRTPRDRRARRRAQGHHARSGHPARRASPTRRAGGRLAGGRAARRPVHALRLHGRTRLRLRGLRDADACRPAGQVPPTCRGHCALSTPVVSELPTTRPAPAFPHRRRWSDGPVGRRALLALLAERLR
jgi:hypothetical protein